MVHYGGKILVRPSQTKSRLVMSSLVSRDRRNSHWDQEERVWGKSRPVVQQGEGIPATQVGSRDRQKGEPGTRTD